LARTDDIRSLFFISRLAWVEAVIEAIGCPGVSNIEADTWTQHAAEFGPLGCSVNLSRRGGTSFRCYSYIEVDEPIAPEFMSAANLRRRERGVAVHINPTGICSKPPSINLR